MRISAILLLLLAACTTAPPAARRPNPSDRQLASYDTRLLSFYRIQGANRTPDRIITDLSLPARGQYGSSITWTASGLVHGASLDTRTGVLVQGTEDSPCLLTATVTRGPVTLQTNFRLLIHKPRPMTVFLVSPATRPPLIRVGVNHRAFRDRPMQPAGAGRWYHREERANILSFAFGDGSGTFSPAERKHYFTSELPEIWIREGFMHPTDPRGPQAADRLVVLTLNLHTWQEKEARRKLDIIADAIARLKPDFVCLQECAQHRDAPPVTDPRAPWQQGQDAIRADNAAHLLSKRLADKHGSSWTYRWSWAHYGWNVWEEGVAVLSRHPVLDHDGQFISAEKSTATIHSRKAVRITADVRGLGRINVFSVHTSWWKSGLPEQIDALKAYAEMKRKRWNPAATIIAGDFNAPAGEAGYDRLTAPGANRLVDSYLEVNPGGMTDRTIDGGGRIDYIFFMAGDRIVPLTSQRWFLDDPLLGGKVSDHCGVITVFGRN